MAQDGAPGALDAIAVSDVESVTTVVRTLASKKVVGLSKDQLMDVMEAAGVLQRVTGAFFSQLAGEVARMSDPELPGGGFARKQGHKSPGKMIEKVTGVSPQSANRQIEAGDAFSLVPDEAGLEADGGAGGDAAGDMPVAEGGAPAVRHKYPKVAAASVAGELSVDAAALIVGALNDLRLVVEARVLEDVEARLVKRAKGRTPSDVRRIVSAAKSRLDKPGVEQRQRRQHSERYFSWKHDHTGVVTLHGVLDAVTAAPVLTVLEQMVTKGFRSRRDSDPTNPGTRTVGQMRADALFELARHALGCEETERSGVRTSLVVRVDLEDMLRGVGMGRIDGIDELVPVRELRRLAGDAGVIPEVLGRDGEVLDLGQQVRLFTRPQRIALLERDGGCAKCHAPPEHCEAHHIRWWEHGGVSDLSNGVMLCTRCHHDVHRQGWEIEPHANGVTFIPPVNIDPERQPQPGGLAALDIGEVVTPSIYPADWEITDELEERVWQWEMQARLREEQDEQGVAAIGWPA